MTVLSPSVPVSRKTPKEYLCNGITNCELFAQRPLPAGRAAAACARYRSRSPGRHPHFHTGDNSASCCAASGRSEWCLYVMGNLYGRAHQWDHHARAGRAGRAVRGRACLDHGYIRLIHRRLHLGAHGGWAGPARNPDHHIIGDPVYAGGAPVVAAAYCHAGCVRHGPRPDCHLHCPDHIQYADGCARGHAGVRGSGVRRDNAGSDHSSDLACAGCVAAVGSDHRDGWRLYRCRVLRPLRHAARC